MAVQTTASIVPGSALSVTDRAAASAGFLATATQVWATLAQAPVMAASDRAPKPVQLSQAVDRVNQRFKDSRTDLRFSVDDASGQLVVAVVDAEDGTVLRQIPGEEVLRIAEALDRALDSRKDAAPGTLIERSA